MWVLGAEPLLNTYFPSLRQPPRVLFCSVLVFTYFVLIAYILPTGMDRGLFVLWPTGRHSFPLCTSR